MDRDGAQLDADGLEMYEGFSYQSGFQLISTMSAAPSGSRFCDAHAVLLAELHDADPEERKRNVERQAQMIAVTRRLGGPGRCAEC